MTKVSAANVRIRSELSPAHTIQRAPPHDIPSAEKTRRVATPEAPAWPIKIEAENSFCTCSGGGGKGDRSSHGHHIYQSVDQPGKVANPASGQLNTGGIYTWRCF